MPATFQRETLRRASREVGDLGHLSGRLGVPAESLRAMVEGREVVPTWLFLRTVDLLNDHAAQSGPPASDPPPEA